MKGAALQRPTHAAMVRGSQAIGLTRALASAIRTNVVTSPGLLEPEMSKNE